MRFSSSSTVRSAVSVKVRYVFRLGIRIRIPSVGDRWRTRNKMSNRVSIGSKGDEAGLSNSHVLRLSLCEGGQLVQRDTDIISRTNMDRLHAGCSGADDILESVIEED